MRITENATLSLYQANLNNIRNRLVTEQFRVATGKQNRTPSDEPRVVAEVKRLTNTIDQNEVFQSNIADAFTDTQIFEDTLENFNGTLNTIRSTASDAANPINFDKLPTLGEVIRQQLNDLIETANREFDGRFAFAGTLTTRGSIVPTGAETNNLPFELIEDPALVSTENPRGLRVAFKGNNENRVVRTSTNTTERINTKAEEAFGANSVEVFNNIINMYNTIVFNPDGTERTNLQALEIDRARDLQGQIKNLGDSIDSVSSEIGRLGAVAERMTLLDQQISFENSRLSDLRSVRADADLVESALQVRREQSVLDSALAIGANIVQQSLLDFLR